MTDDDITGNEDLSDFIKKRYDKTTRDFLLDNKVKGLNRDGLPLVSFTRTITKEEICNFRWSAINIKMRLPPRDPDDKGPAYPEYLECVITEETSNLVGSNLYKLAIRRVKRCFSKQLNGYFLIPTHVGVRLKMKRGAKKGKKEQDPTMRHIWDLSERFRESLYTDMIDPIQEDIYKMMGITPGELKEVTARDLAYTLDKDTNKKILERTAIVRASDYPELLADGEEGEENPERGDLIPVPKKVLEEIMRRRKEKANNTQS